MLFYKNNLTCAAIGANFAQSLNISFSDRPSLPIGTALWIICPFSSFWLSGWDDNNCCGSGMEESLSSSLPFWAMKPSSSSTFSVWNLEFLTIKNIPYFYSMNPGCSPQPNAIEGIPFTSVGLHFDRRSACFCTASNISLTICLIGVEAFIFSEIRSRFWIVDFAKSGVDIRVGEIFCIVCFQLRQFEEGKHYETFILFRRKESLRVFEKSISPVPCSLPSPKSNVPNPANFIWTHSRYPTINLLYSLECCSP